MSTSWWIVGPACGVAASAAMWTATQGVGMVGIVVLTHFQVGLLVITILTCVFFPNAPTVMWLMAIGAAATVAGLSIKETHQRRRNEIDEGAEIAIPITLFVYAFLHTLLYTQLYHSEDMQRVLPFIMSRQEPLRKPSEAKEGSPAQ